MIRNKIWFVVLLLPTLAWGSAPGTTALAFLKIGVGARSAGMGDCGIALCEDATATYWNPAKLLGFRAQKVALGHNQWMQGVRYEQASWAASTGWIALGFAASGLYVTDLELREGATELPLETFSAYDLSFGASLAMRFGASLQTGLTYKRLYERIYVDHGTGWAWDVGAAYETPFSGLQVAGVIADIGPKFKLVQQGYKLPTTFKLGLGYEPQRTIWRGRGSAGLELVKAIDNDLKVNLGGEYWYREKIALRAGYKFRSDTETLTTGAGFRVGKIILDYAFVPNRLGSTHRAGLGYSW
jgi:Type IX secretion system protein PorV